jgi:hypothetical protein
VGYAQYRAVVDFCGPTYLVLLPGNEDEKSREGLLIGAAPLLRSDFLQPTFEREKQKQNSKGY